MGRHRREVPVLQDQMHGVLRAGAGRAEEPAGKEEEVSGVIRRSLLDRGTGVLSRIGYLCEKCRKEGSEGVTVAPLGGGLSDERVAASHGLMS